MAHKGKRREESSEELPENPTLADLAKLSQLDFEMHFFGGILQSHPDYVDVLRVLANNMTLKGRIRDGLEIDRRLCQLRPHDPLAHYNLACSFALLKRAEPALKALRRAVELGYHDFHYMQEDHDLDYIRDDPRYRQIIREYERREGSRHAT